MDQAARIHGLLGEVFETSLRQQLMTGDFNPAMIGRIVDWIKHNNVTCTEEADQSLAKIAAAFRRSGESLEDMLEGMGPTTI